MDNRRRKALRPSGRYTPPNTERTTPPSGPCRCPACLVDDGVSFDFAAEWQRMQDIIRRFGHAVQFVGGDDNGFDWAYTIGRLRKGRPELVITGADPELAAMVLNEVVAGWDRMWEAPDGVITLPGSHRHRCRLVEVPDELWDSDLLLGAQRDAVERGLTHRRTALQVLTPDRVGKFPTDPDASIVTRRAQPLLGRQPGT
jgi:Domain of unknown function (DUF4262)